MNDLAKLRDELAVEYEKILAGLVQGSSEDLAAFAAKMAEHSAFAIAEGRPDLLDHLFAQAIAMQEVGRLRAVNASWSAISGTLLAVSRLVVKAALGAAAA
jgi:hypothetical protein